MSHVSPSIRLITEVLEYMVEVVKTYPWQGKLIFKTLVGFDGMGPDISIQLVALRRIESGPDAELQFWCHPHPQGTIQYVLIYSAFDPHTTHIDHLNIDISHVEEATPFLKKALMLFGIDAVTLS